MNLPELMKTSSSKKSQHSPGLKIATSQLTRLHFINSTVNRDPINPSLILCPSPRASHDTTELSVLKVVLQHQSDFSY